MFQAIQFLVFYHHMLPTGHIYLGSLTGAPVKLSCCYSSESWRQVFTKCSIHVSPTRLQDDTQTQVLQQRREEELPDPSNPLWLVSRKELEAAQDDDV